MTLLRYVVRCGAGAALASLTTTAALAKAEGRHALRPINASSHWLWGEEAGRQTRLDLPYTSIGGATNIGAGLLWGAIFGSLVHSHQRLLLLAMIRDGAALGEVAGALDYGILPRRLTPGWELALSDRSVLLSTPAMAAGAVAGGIMARAMDADVGHDECRFRQCCTPGYQTGTTGGKATQSPCSKP